jgi:hypothetical protein
MIRANACAAQKCITKAPRLFPILLMIAVAMPAQDRPQRAGGSVRQPLDAETDAVATAFWNKILPACGDSRYYAGSELEIHIHGDRGGAARANNGLTEYAGVTFPGDQLRLSPADEANGVERKGESFMVPARWRERIPGQNTWQEWVSPSADSNPLDALKTLAVPAHFGFTGLMAMELWKVKGQWYYRLPSGTKLIPADEITPRKISCENVLHTPGLPPIANGRITSAPDVHCRDSLNNPVAVEEVLREDARRWCGITPERWDELNGKHTTNLVPVASGHSLNDTYAQAQAIAQGNVSKGIRDIINPSYLKARLPLPVCFSIDAAGNCQKSGETIWLPGDLAQPLDWNKLQQPGVCRPPQPDQIEIVLKGTPTDDKRKRFVRCAVAGSLASVRKDLLALGVKDESTTTSSAAAIPPAANTQQPGPRPATNSVELAPGKNAVTTRGFPDPRGRGPECEIPEGTQVLVQSIDKQTGKVQLFVVPNGKRDSRKCTNFLTADRTELRAIEGYPTPK